MRKHDTGEKRMQIAGGHPPRTATLPRFARGSETREEDRASAHRNGRLCGRASAKLMLGTKLYRARSKKKMGEKGMRQPRVSATRARRLRPGDLRTSPAEFMARTACAVPFPASYADRSASSPTQCWLAVLPTFMCARVCVYARESSAPNKTCTCVGLL